jgi:hypothetical protein
MALGTNAADTSHGTDRPEREVALARAALGHDLRLSKCQVQRGFRGEKREGDAFAGMGLNPRGEIGDNPISRGGYRGDRSGHVKGVFQSPGGGSFMRRFNEWKSTRSHY